MGFVNGLSHGFYQKICPVAFIKWFVPWVLLMVCPMGFIKRFVLWLLSKDLSCGFYQKICPMGFIKRFVPWILLMVCPMGFIKRFAEKLCGVVCVPVIRTSIPDI